MAWIQEIEPDTVQTESPKSPLARLYRACLDPETGRLDNILKVHSLRPDTLDAHLRLWVATCRPKHALGLGRRERELIGIAVSAHNHCHY